MKTLLFFALFAVAFQIQAQTARKVVVQKPVVPDVREIGGTNYHVHVRLNGQLLPHWKSLHAKVVRTTMDGLLLQKATEIKRVTDPLVPSSAWTEIVWDDKGDLILLLRYPKAKELIAGQRIQVLAMRVGNHELKDGVSIAKFDYGRPVDMKAVK